MKSFFIILSSVGILACSGGQLQPNLIPEEKFVEFYSELLILREQHVSPSADSGALRAKIDSLHRAFGVTPNNVHETIEFYVKDLERWKRFYGAVIQRLEVVQREGTSAPSI